MLIARMPYCFSAEQLSLVHAFNIKQNEIAEDFVKHIDDHVETYTKEIFQQQSADDQGEVFEVEVKHIAGISEDEYDFKDIFISLMPMYQHQSMLISNWSMFECELKQFYSSLAKEIGRSPDLPAKQRGVGSDFCHVINCFRKIGLLSEPTKDFVAACDFLNNQVRHIRNDWVHNGGVPTRTKDPESLDGITLNGNQINISMKFIEMATQSMWKVTTELSGSSRKVLAAKSRQEGE
jgi:hypothetical protein